MTCSKSLAVLLIVGLPAFGSGASLSPQLAVVAPVPAALSPEEIVALLEQEQFARIEDNFARLREETVSIDGPYPKLEKAYEGVGRLGENLPPAPRADLLRRLVEWKKQSPQASTPALLAAYIHLQRADALRMGKPLSELTPAEAASVKTEADLAGEQIEGLDTREAVDITCHTAAIRVSTARGESWFGFRGLQRFEAVRGKNPQYRPLYLWMTRNGRETLEYRSEWTNFIEQECERWPGLPGDVLYVRMLRTLGTNQITGLAWDNLLDYTRLRRGLAEILTRDSQAADMLNFAAFCAWMTGDGQWLAEAYPHIGQQWTEGVWGTEDTYRQGGAARNRILVPSPCFAKALLEAGDFGRLQEIYEGLRPLTAEDTGQLAPLSCFYQAVMQGRNDNREPRLVVQEERMRRWQEALPGSVVPPIALGKLEIIRAWNERGSGYADTVTEAGWEGFKLHLGRAEAHLRRARELETRDPEIFSALLIVAKGQSWPLDQTLALVRAGAEIAPDYLPIYHQALDYLEPKWGGSEEAQTIFIKEVSDRRGGSAGDELYAKLCHYYLSCIGWPDFFQKSGLAYDRVSRGYRSLRQRSPDSRYLLHSQALFACLGRDRETASALLNEIGDEFIAEHWLTRETFQQWRDWSEGKGPPSDR